jgi:putative transposase
MANQRRDFAHQVSRRVVNDHDLIVYENLKIKNMTRRPKPRPDQQGGYEPNGARAKAGLNRSINDAGWGTIRAMIDYKAESAGREVIAVDPRNTVGPAQDMGMSRPGNGTGPFSDVSAVAVRPTRMSMRPRTSFGPVVPGCSSLRRVKRTHYP